MKVTEIHGIAHFHFSHLGLHHFKRGLPQGSRDVGPGRGRAFLPLELESASNQRSGQGIHVRRRVGHDKVLTPGFTHDAGIGPIVFDIGADGFPDTLEG